MRLGKTRHPRHRSRGLPEPPGSRRERHQVDHVATNGPSTAHPRPLIHARSSPRPDHLEGAANDGLALGFLRKPPYSRSAGGFGPSQGGRAHVRIFRSRRQVRRLRSRAAHHRHGLHLDQQPARMALHQGCQREGPSRRSSGGAPSVGPSTEGATPRAATQRISRGLPRGLRTDRRTTLPTSHSEHEPRARPSSQSQGEGEVVRNVKSPTRRSVGVTPASPLRCQ